MEASSDASGSALEEINSLKSRVAKLEDFVCSIHLIWGVCLGGECFCKNWVQLISDIFIGFVWRSQEHNSLIVLSESQSFFIFIVKQRRSLSSRGDAKGMSSAIFEQTYINIRACLSLYNRLFFISLIFAINSPCSIYTALTYPCRRGWLRFHACACVRRGGQRAWLGCFPAERRSAAREHPAAAAADSAYIDRHRKQLYPGLLCLSSASRIWMCELCKGVWSLMFWSLRYSALYVFEFHLLFTNIYLFVQLLFVSLKFSIYQQVIIECSYF